MSTLQARWFGPALPAVLGRLLVATALLLTLALTQGSALSDALLPAYRAVFGLVADEFVLVRLEPDREGADSVLRAVVRWKGANVLGGHVIYPDARGLAQGSTLALQGLYGSMVALIAALAWPAAAGLREFSLRLVWLVPALIVLMLCDTPCVLAGEIWQIGHDYWAPDVFSPLIAWKSFLQGGGRYALGLAAAAAAIYAASPLRLRRK